MNTAHEKPEKEPAPKTKRRIRASGPAAVALFALLLLAGGFFIIQDWRQSKERLAPPDDLAARAERMTLKKRMPPARQVKKETPAMPEAQDVAPLPMPAAPGDTNQRIQALEEQLQQLSGTLEEMARLREELAALQQKLAALEKQPEALPPDYRSVLAQVIALEEQVRSGVRFDDTLTQLLDNDLLPADAGVLLAELSDISHAGVASEETLRTQFEEALQRHLTQGSGGGDASFWGGVKANLRGLVNVRKIGDVSGDDDEAVIARAEQAVAEDKFDVAVKELSRLSDGATAAFVSWIEAAGTRMEALAVVAHTREKLLGEAFPPPESYEAPLTSPGI